MALKLPGLKFFSGTDAKSRVFILVAGVVGVGILLYGSIRLIHGNQAETTGPTKVAGPPGGLTSVPGSELSPEYYRALNQANEQASQQAKMSGSSAVSTLLNVPGQGTGDCTVLCPNPDNPNVADDINNLVQSGKLSKEDGDRLLALAAKNASVDEYAAALDELVRQGKLTPEQARALLEKYKKQHANALMNESARGMDALIKSGQLPLDAANDLLALQKMGVSPEDYAAELQRLVREGKISPATAAQLLAQYTQQMAREKAKDGAFAITEMAKRGELTPDVAKALADMVTKNVPYDQYEEAIKKLVADGKMTPATAAKLLAQYKAQRTALGASGLLGDMLTQGGPKAELAKRLLNLQANNASLSDYMDELKRAVAAGLITPEQAAELLRQYQAQLAPVSFGTVPTITPNLPGAEDFAKLQQRIQSQPQAAAVPVATAADFAAAATQTQEVMTQDRMERIQQIQAAMMGQASQLMAAWQPPAMQHMAGAISKTNEKPLGPSGTNASGEAGKGTSGSQSQPVGPPLIKTGTILFAVLDTSVDSDYPDTPVMATIVQGEFKGARLLGKLTLATGQDRVSLNFTQMDRDDWLQVKPITAYAIDPDTARTVMASSVDYHYLQRYGAMMGASFLSGYSSAITQAGTSTTGIFGTSSTHPELSAGNKIAVGLGQIGTNLTSMAQTYINKPATVRVNSGVGLGILFTADVAQ